MTQENLTPHSDLPYSGKRMETSDEKPISESASQEDQNRAKAKEKAEKKPAQKAENKAPSREQIETARKAWEEFNKGRNLSADEQQSIRIIIENGISPDPEKSNEERPEDSEDSAERFRRETLKAIFKERGISEKNADILLNILLDPEKMGTVREASNMLGHTDNSQRASLFVTFIKDPSLSKADRDNIQTLITSMLNESERQQAQKANNPNLEFEEDSPTPQRASTGGEPPRRPPNRPTATGGEDDDDGEYEENDPNRPVRNGQEHLARLQRERKGGSALEVFEAEVSQIQGPEMLRKYMDENVKQLVDAFPEDGFRSSIIPGKTTKEWFDNARRAINEGNTDAIKGDINLLIRTLMSQHSTSEMKDQEKIPESLEDYLELVMARSTEEYKSGGMYELVNEDGEINFANFATWIRRAMIFWTNFSPDNPQVDVFNAQKVMMLFRSITLGEVLFEGNEQYIRRRVKKNKIDAQTGQVGITTDYVKDDTYEAFRYKMMNEIFYFQTSRNQNIYNNQTKEDLDELSKVLKETLPNSVLTRSDGFLSLFSSAGSTERNMVGEGSENNARVGELVSIAEKAYQQIYNLEELQRLFGKDSTLFKKDFIEADDGRLTFKDPDKEPKSGEAYDKNGAKIEDHYDKRKGRANVGNGVAFNWNEKWYDEKGVLKTRADGDDTQDWRKGQFLDYINVFNEQNKDQKVINEVRERIRQSLMDRTLKTLKNDDGSYKKEGKLYEYLSPKLEADIKKKYNKVSGDDNFNELFDVKLNQSMMQFAYDDARIAEETAFTFGWMGTRGFNDTTFTGWAADTQAFHTLEYRTGQGDETKIGSSIGIPRTIGINKAMIVPIYAGIKTVDGDVFQGKIDKLANKYLSEHHGGVVDESTIGKTSMDIAKEFRFKSDELKYYYRNHFARGVTEYKSYAGSSEWNLDKIVTWDPFIGYAIDRAALYKVFDEELVKPGRYRVSGWADTDYNKDIENFEIVKTAKGQIAHSVEEDGEEHMFRVVAPKKEKLGAFMFGKQVYDRAYRKPVNGRDDKGAPIPDRDGKVRYTDEPDYEFANGRGRGAFWKEPLIMRIAAEIKSHRDPKDISPYWDNPRVTMFFQALGKLPADIHVDESDISKTYSQGRAFSPEQLNYIRKLAGVSEMWMDVSDIVLALLSGLFLGTATGIKKGVTASMK